MLDKLNPILRGASTAEKFLVIAFARMLDEQDLLDEVLRAAGGEVVDLNKPAGGKALIHWQGKSVEDIRKEAGNSAGEVLAALEAAGIRAESERLARATRLTPVAITAAKGERPEDSEPGEQIEGQGLTPISPTGEKLDTLEGNSGGSGEGGSDPDEKSDVPMYAGRPVTALVGLSDDALLAIDGIGKATVVKIREWQASQALD